MGILPSGTKAGGCQLAASGKRVVTAQRGSSIPPAAGAAAPDLLRAQLVEEQLGHAKDRRCHESDVSGTGEYI